MKNFVSLIMVLAVVAFFAMPSHALNTLYGQEGTTADGYSPINAAGVGPATNPNSTNWKYQYGGTHTDSAVYSWDSNAWVESTDNGIDGNLDIECDIEMFVSESITDPKIYFHFGNPYALTESDRTAYVNGTMTSNHGEYVGVTFNGAVKSATSFEMSGSDFTGRIFDAMVGTIDNHNTAVNDSFDMEILMSWGAGYRVPDEYGDGAHSTIHDSLWWLVNDGAPGAYNLTWKITMLPEAHQKDGNYQLDPTIVVAPVL